MPCCIPSFPYLGASRQQLACPRNELELQALLQRSGVDTRYFGQGQAKPLITLFRELREGSCRLERDRQTKQVYRCVEPVFVQLTYNGKVLVERVQGLPNGNRRVRNSVLAEKREPDDASPLDAAFRGIVEELHVEVSLSTEGLVYSPHDDLSFVERMDSSSYPGIPAIYATHFVRLNIMSGSDAERAFTSCGLPACRPFETEEGKFEGILTHFWEWTEFHEALHAGVKGMPPRPTEVDAKPGGA